MVPNGYMSVNEAKQRTRNELKTASKNYLNEHVEDPVLQVKAPRREILQMRINSNTYFKPEERRRRYKEVEYDPYNDNYANAPEMPMVAPEMPSPSLPSKVGGRKSRKARKNKKSRRHTKSRKHKKIRRH
jgi:hypothetical protein